MSAILQTLNSIFKIIENIPLQILPFIFAFSFVLFAIQWGKKRHLLCKLEASQQLKRLSKLSTPQKQITHLQGVNPFVFEEMILTALKNKGYKIKRNKRYSKDGGIDGQVLINNQHYLIQAKRYKNHINPAHVQDFVQICRKRKKRGLFIHTGKTGKKSQQIAKNSNIEIINGTRLLNMLINRL